MQTGASGNQDFVNATAVLTVPATVSIIITFKEPVRVPVVRGHARKIAILLTAQMVDA